MSSDTPDPADTAPAGDAAEQPAAKRITPRAIIVAAAIALVVLSAAAGAIALLTGGGDPAPAAAGPTGPPVPTSTAAASAEPSSPAPPPTPGQGADTPETGAVREVAEQAVQAINSHDPEAMRKISCDQAAEPAIDNTLPEARVELVSTPELAGDTATVELKLIIGDQSVVTPMPLRKQNGTWCLD